MVLIGFFGFDMVLKPRISPSYMFLRHTRENENGASALITVGADRQSFKTTVIR